MGVSKESAVILFLSMITSGPRHAVFFPSQRACSTSGQRFFRRCLSPYVGSSASRSFFSLITAAVTEVFHIFCLKVPGHAFLGLGLESGVSGKGEHQLSGESSFQTIKMFPFFFFHLFCHVVCLSVWLVSLFTLAQRRGRKKSVYLPKIVNKLDLSSYIVVFLTYQFLKLMFR